MPTDVKALATLAPASRGYGLDAGCARSTTDNCPTMPHSTHPRGEDDLGPPVPRALHALLRRAGT